MYFSTVFLNVLLNCISQLYFLTVKWCAQQQKADHVCNRPTLFLNCISQLYFSTVFLNVLRNCISQLYFSTVKWCVQQQKADHVCNMANTAWPTNHRLPDNLLFHFDRLLHRVVEPVVDCSTLWKDSAQLIAFCGADMSFSDFCTLASLRHMLTEDQPACCF